MALARFGGACSRHSSTADIGMTNVSPPTPTPNPGMTASVSGRRIETTVPVPSVVSTKICAAHPFDVAADDVHPHSSSGGVGDPVGGGEAALK